MKKIFFIIGLLFLGSYSQVAFASPAVEQSVREYFADIPVMVEIARCESKFRQFVDSGNVLRGGAGGQMVGVFQFFDRYHTSPAYGLGFDIETVDGNLAYARYVYDRQGTAPWNSTRDCWDVPELRTLTPEPLAAVTVSESVVENADDVTQQKITLMRQVIELLQTLLSLRRGSTTV
jgi:hypothetical protein